jgi:hypothetical protein
MQTNIPHLKLILPFQDTREIKTLKATGIVFQEILAWLDGNVAPNAKVLFIPNERSMVNVLGIASGYYLNASRGGQLTIGVEGIKYSEMTTKNIELMNSGLPQPMPITVLPLDGLQDGQFDLIILENSNYHRQLSQTTAARIIIIRRESAETTIKDSVFPAHSKFEILKGRTSADIRALPPQ